MLDIETVVSSLSVAFVALGLALSFRATGTFLLEHAVAALIISFVVLISLRGGRSGVSIPTLAAVAIISLLVGECLYHLYYSWRSVRGGESSSLVTSYAVMNTLALLAERVTQGRSIQTRLELSGVALISCLALSLLIIWWMLRRSRLEAQVKLARDARGLLQSFGVSPRKVIFYTKLVSVALLTFGALGYLLTKENFSISRLELLLIPSFAVVLATVELSVLRITIFSAAIVICEYSMIYFLGNSVLVKVYQSGLFLVMVALPTLRTEKKSGIQTTILLTD